MTQEELKERLEAQALDEDESLKKMRRAVRKESDEDESLRDDLLITAVSKEGVIFFRPFAAAYSWLSAHPRWMEKATGSEGAEWRSLTDVLDGFARRQRYEDSMLELTVPPELALSSSGPPSPLFSSPRR